MQLSRGQDVYNPVKLILASFSCLLTCSHDQKRTILFVSKTRGILSKAEDALYPTEISEDL